MSTLSTRLVYGLGGAVYAVKEAAYTMFILLFYTQVLGLNGTMTGAIIALSLIWDAISDPLVGALSDRLRSPHGRRHPFMAASILPMGIGFLGLFSPPDSILGSDWALGLWLLFWSLWVRSFVTLFSIPHLALSTDISRDYHERSQVLGARLALLFLFSVLVPAFALLFIFQAQGSTDGRFLRENYPLYGIFSCLVCWLVATLSCFGTRRFATPSSTQSGLPPSTKSGNSLSRDLLRTLSNPSFRNLIGFDIAMMASYGAISALNMLVWTFYWEFDAREISIILSLPSLLAVILVMLSLRPLGRRLEKYQLLQFSALALILNCLWLYPMHMTGILESASSAMTFGLNFLTMLVYMYFFLMRGIQTQSIVADITDEHDWNHGLRQEAGFFAASNFANKTATVFGPLYGGVALDVVGIRAGMLPGEIPQPVLDNLIIAFGLGAIPAMVVGLFFALRISLSHKRVEELQHLLRARDAPRDL